MVSSCSEELKRLQKNGDVTDEELPILVSLEGNIVSYFGNEKDLVDWYILLLQKSTNRGYLSKISANGTYSLSSVPNDLPFNIYLLNPDLQLASVLYYLDEENIARQYFYPLSNLLPFIINKGYTLEIGNENGIKWDEKHSSIDSNANTAPDGIEQHWGTTFDHAPSPAANTYDRDLDGIANIFDRDDDNDGKLDIFDLDSDADGKADQSAETHDQFFTNDINFFAITITKELHTDSEPIYYLHINGQLNSTFSTAAVNLLAPDSLLQDASIVLKDENGVISETTFNGALHDDGLHFDRKAGDSLYSAKIKLSGNPPRDKQVLFLELISDGGEKVYFGHSVQGVSLGTVIASINEGEVTISGEPFPSDSDYQWSILIQDEGGKAVFQSPPISRDQTTYSVPLSSFADASLLSYKVLIYSPHRILGFPYYIIETPLQSVVTL